MSIAEDLARMQLLEGGGVRESPSGFALDVIVPYLNGRPNLLQQAVDYWRPQLEQSIGPGLSETVAQMQQGNYQPPTAETIWEDPFMQALQPGNLAFKAQTAYHGSPYKWNKVDLSKAGTGEGAAVYGHGFYAADLDQIARGYRDKLSRTKFNILDETENESIPEWVAERITSGTMSTAEAIAEWEKRLNEAKLMAKTSAQPWIYESNAEWHKKILESLEKLHKKQDFTSSRGYLYKLDIPDHENLLDWDKPLSEQPEKVRKALEDAFTNGKIKRPQKTVYPDDTNIPGRGIFSIDLDGIDDFKPAKSVPDESIPGSELYKRIASELGSPQAASEYLRSIGIPGHKYLDQGSRGAGAGTYNYVIYDPEAVNVLEMSKTMKPDIPSMLAHRILA